MSEALIEDDPTLTLVRGHYLDPIWGEQEHWWCVKPDGTVVDPTAKQFPSKGNGVYIPFNGIVTCAECGKELEEKSAIMMGRYPCCSDMCCLRLVGL
jgi:hypothetical protein